MGVRTHGIRGKFQRRRADIEAITLHGLDQPRVIVNALTR